MRALSCSLAFHGKLRPGEDKECGCGHAHKTKETLVLEPKVLRTGAIFTDRDVAFGKGLGPWGSE